MTHEQPTDPPPSEPRAAQAPRPQVASSEISQEQWLTAVKALLDLAERSDTRQIEIDAGSWRVRILRAAESPAKPPPSSGTGTSAALPHRPATNHHQVLAPLTGIWYDAPTPGAAPYVQTGSHVEVGTVIGLVETMKIFNEISSDARGTVTQVHVRGGDLVQFHTPLISVDPSETPGTWLERT